DVECVFANIDADRHQLIKVVLRHATSPVRRNRQSLTCWVKQPVHPITGQWTAHTSPIYIKNRNPDPDQNRPKKQTNAKLKNKWV
ncbi:MAG: hypothetical protein AAGG57_18900, partial [Pseudomonadota bacterium]